MLELKQVKKTYVMGDERVDALKGVSLTFQDHEFVAILGPSGCGKTTMLNIIGGLDHYTSGDIMINGVSTKNYNDREWDAYRNHSVGFVFQNYQLIPHQTILQNVELTMTLSGVSKSERRKRAIEALEKVGLKNQIRKRPNQMSGGQAQRAAIARALVNDPEIILADEPTGALDTQTSVQVMEILKEVSKERLVIMVTHNPELAEQYATRIVRCRDGEVIADEKRNQLNFVHRTVEAVGAEPARNAAQPKNVQETAQPKKKRKNKTSMSLGTAFALSLNNLMTKKGRTFLTAFAGAIGIIGIALIYAASAGVQAYIDKVESDTLASYPISISKETVDFTEMMSSIANLSQGAQEVAENITEVQTVNLMATMMSSVASGRASNDMRKLKAFLQDNEEMKKYVQTIEYGYSSTLYIYNKNGISDKGFVQVNPSTVISNIGMSGGTMAGMGSGYNVFEELPQSENLVNSMYDLVSGRMPEKYDEVVIAVTQAGYVGDYFLYALGLEDQSELSGMMQDIILGRPREEKEGPIFSFEELEKLEFQLLLGTDFYEAQKDGTYVNRRENDFFVRDLLNREAITLKVVGIVQCKESAPASANSYGGVLYSNALMKEVLGRIEESDVVRAQMANPEIDIFTGKAFAGDKEVELTMADLEAYIESLPENQQSTVTGMIDALRLQGMTDEEIVEQFASYLKEDSDSTYDDNLARLGVKDEDNPDRIYIYPLDFSAKEKVTDLLDRYGESLDEGEELKYTDYVGLIMSSVTSIINVITYVLIGFVGVSLVVSSIMIGIITYISVLERTREIGILRAIGASKKDISRVFNAETLLIGLVSGIIGVTIPYGISLIVSQIVKELFDVPNIMSLSWQAALILIAISMFLTFIGGLIPSGIAARKDPVEALRSE